MANELFGFEWDRAVRGYEWFEIESDKDFFPLLEPGDEWLLKTKDGGRETYRPLEEFTGLYRTFAELSPEKQPVLDFANKSGYLGTTATWHPSQFAPEVEDGSVDPVIGETLSEWTTHILTMRDAVEVWDLVTSKDRQGLLDIERKRHLFTAVPPHRSREMPLMELPHEEETLADLRHLHDDPRNHYLPGHRPLDPEHVFIGRILETAKSFLTREVNEHLVEQVVTPRLESDDRDQARFYVVPRNLFGAMWLQFAEAIGQQKRYRRCQLCATQFEISRGRSDRQFCTTACKTEFHNSKRRKVRELRSKGHPLPKIAKQFDTDIPTVKKWLGETSQPRKRTRRT